MFLLIHNNLKQKDIVVRTFKFHYVSINSYIALVNFLLGGRFKFHYVSINSEADDIGDDNPNNFKFHYVSINSVYNQMYFSFLLPLNSIMFLLILCYAIICTCICMTLNSIMFLLILWFIVCVTNFLMSFKFHYVSINS